MSAEAVWLCWIGALAVVWQWCVVSVFVWLFGVVVVVVSMECHRHASQASQIPFGKYQTEALRQWLK